MRANEIDVTGSNIGILQRAFYRSCGSLAALVYLAQMSTLGCARHPEDSGVDGGVASLCILLGLDGQRRRSFG
jgi:hypothetical protein